MARFPTCIRHAKPAKIARREKAIAFRPRLYLAFNGGLQNRGKFFIVGDTMSPVAATGDIMSPVIRYGRSLPMRRPTTIEQKIRQREHDLAHRQRMAGNQRDTIVPALAHAQGLQMEPKPIALLRAIIDQACLVGGMWVFDGSLTVLAHQAGCSKRHALRCMADFVRRGLLAPTGRSNGRGKPKEYIVRVEAGEDVNC